MGFLDRRAERQQEKETARLGPELAPHLEPDESVQALTGGFEGLGLRKRLLAVATERHVYVFRATVMKGRPKEMVAKHPIGQVPIDWRLDLAANVRGMKTAPLKIGETVFHVPTIGV